jgi:hypothetical protein
LSGYLTRLPDEVRNMTAAISVSGYPPYLDLDVGLDVEDPANRVALAVDRGQSDGDETRLRERCDAGSSVPATWGLSALRRWSSRRSVPDRG